MIDQHTGNLVVVDEVQHRLYLLCFDGLSKLDRLEVDVGQLVKLLPSSSLDAKLTPQCRVEAIAEDYILRPANHLRLTISQQISIILFFNTCDILLQ